MDFVSDALTGLLCPEEHAALMQTSFSDLPWGELPTVVSCQHRRR